MRSTVGTVILALIAASSASCAGSGATPATSPPVTTSTIPPPASTVPAPVECPGAGVFEEGGDVAEFEGDSFESSLLGNISWEVNDQCESFVFEFETPEGAPATSVPDVRVGHLESFQVLRVSMGVNAAVLADQLVETELVEELYVVRALDGGMFVDLHLASPAAARARFQESPATLTLDLRPGFVQFTGTAETGDRIVAVSPSSGARVVTPTVFTGYSRALESNVVIIVTQEDDVVAEVDTTSADSTDIWGEFREEVALPIGDVAVFLGEASPEDGSLSGITIDLTVS